ncbi:MAG: peroxiredoxin [Ectothiorhodospiraceae bacterium]|nr:peroxiredoxin [Ectothiorhodospiraceae bacterium]
MPATSDKTLSLSDFRGGKLILYFYPKASTPGCTQEGQDFRDLHGEFRAAGAAILGASRDAVKAQQNFKDKYAFPFELLSDKDETLCQLFGVIKEKNMYGRKVMGIERSTFLIDAEGVLRKEWRGVKVKGHAQEVLEAVQAL